jgi:hypothetical protein
MPRRQPIAGLRVVVAVLLLLLGMPALARAQAGWYLTPTLSLAEEYQSNIFGTSSNEESDFVTRITPGLIFGSFSDPLQFSLAYSTDGQIFAENSQLDNFGDNQRAGLNVRYVPERRWTLGLTGSFVRTEDSGDLIAPRPSAATPARGSTPAPGTPPAPGGPPSSAAPPVAPESTVPVVPGVDVGRTRTHYVVVNPWVGYAYNPRTKLDAGYTYTWTDVENGADDRMHRLTAGVSRGLSPRDWGHLREIFDIFDPEEFGTSLSNAVLVGWTRVLTDWTTLFLEVGPRVNDEGDWGVDATARLDHRLENASFFVSYVRTDQLVVGRSGASTTDTGSFGVSYYPLGNLFLTASGNVSHMSPEDGSVADDTIFGVNVSVAYRLNQWVTARAYYWASFQEGGSGDIEHHVVGIALDWRYTLGF